jgi:hypothetical protein
MRVPLEPGLPRGRAAAGAGAEPRARAEPRRAASRRRHGGARAPRHATSRRPRNRRLSRARGADHRGDAPSRGPELDIAAPASHRCAKASQGAMSPAPVASSPPLPGASVPRAGAAARAPREPSANRSSAGPARAERREASCPLAPGPAPSDAAPTPKPPRRAANARLDVRRTFHEPRGPPEVYAERARVCGPRRSEGRHLWAVTDATVASIARHEDVLGCVCLSLHEDVLGARPRATRSSLRHCGRQPARSRPLVSQTGARACDT